MISEEDKKIIREKFEKEKELVEKYKVDKIPATLIFGEREYKIRFFGIPLAMNFLHCLKI